MVDPVSARIYAVGVDAHVEGAVGRAKRMERAGFPLDVRQQFSFGHCCQRRVEGPLQCLSKETEGRRFTVQDVLKKGRGAVRRDCRTSSSRERRKRFTAKHPTVVVRISLPALLCSVCHIAPHPPPPACVLGTRFNWTLPHAAPPTTNLRQSWPPSAK